ncbi:MAG: nicotinate phosphoribosyltransferase [Candidatus Liptonbacteria bacterium]|nr:nicotinate phosphoribosyltransferase [Candidatus Liptonbacteria bacterium]
MNKKLSTPGFNLLTLTDSYKVTHWKQLPPGTTGIYSFFESRGGRYPAVTFYGLQYFLKAYLEGVVVTEEDIVEAKELFRSHFGQDLMHEEGWRHIVAKHGGRLPVIIKAIPEGTTVPVSNVLMTIENTDSKVPWLTNYLETLLVQVWYPTTVATQSRMMKAVILKSLEETGDPSLIDFKLHDFGFRGSTSPESAGIGGSAHLINFKGTDTVVALIVAKQYYGEPMAGFSIPAAEHSTITSWGREHEVDAFRNMLEQFPAGLVAVVSDSYNIYEACRELWGKQLWQKVMERDGTLVVRPDSGHPPTVVVEVLNILGEAFGTTENAKGYKVLNPKIRVIQGDGIDYIVLGQILDAMKAAGWSADNIAFGSGGGLLQKVDRDTQKFAFKCSATLVNGFWQDVMKDPVTDHGKKSKAGRLKLILRDGKYMTVREGDANEPNLLVPVFENGKITKEYSFSEIRERAKL